MGLSFSVVMQATQGGQMQHLYFSIILRPWILVQLKEWNSRTLALQSRALPTEIILLWTHYMSNNIQRNKQKEFYDIYR